MRKDRIALQLYSVRDCLCDDFYGTLKKVKEMGYSGVEFAGLHEHSPEEVKEMCEEIGLVALSAHVPVKKLVEEMDEQVDAYSRLGCKYIVIPNLPKDLQYRPGQEKYNELVENIKILAKKLKEHDMVLQYHNHDWELAKMDDKYLLDVIYADVAPEYLQTQIDTCWINVGGENPVTYLQKYAGRMPTIHLKDFTGKKSEDTFEFRPLGKGLQDFPPIIEAATAGGAEWFIVEQDRPSMGHTRIECAEMSIQYLLSL